MGVRLRSAITEALGTLVAITAEKTEEDCRMKLQRSRCSIRDPATRRAEAERISKPLALLPADDAQASIAVSKGSFAV